METNTTTQPLTLTVEFDIVVSAKTLRREMRRFLDGTSCTWTCIQEVGPAGGHPVVRVTGPAGEVRWICEERYCIELDEVLVDDATAQLQGDLDFIKAELEVLNSMIAHLTFAPTTEGDQTMEQAITRRTRALRAEREALYVRESETVAALANL